MLGACVWVFMQMIRMYLIYAYFSRNLAGLLTISIP